MPGALQDTAPISTAIARPPTADLSGSWFVEIEAGILPCPFCRKDLSCTLLVAGTALVGLLLQMRVFRAESGEHAARIARSVIGKALRDIPLSVLEVKQL